MRGLPTGFWGKTDREGNAWHPLVDHCADVAACTRALLAGGVLRERLERLAGGGRLDPVQCERLAVLAGLHDLGKFNLGFQAKAFPGSGRPEAGHVREALALIASGSEDLLRLSEALGLEEMVGWCESDEHLLRLLVVSVAHHGRPHPLDDDLPHRAALWRDRDGMAPFAGLAELGHRARSWFPAAFARTAQPLPSSPAFENAFSGLVTLADWIGSDTSLFPFRREGDPEDRMAFAGPRAANALRAIGFDTLPARGSLGGTAPDFQTIFRFPPREAQRRIVELPVAERGGLVVLEAETGSGKTEAALAHFLALLAAGRVDGMYFALPTRTAATQIHGRVVRAIADAFPVDLRPPVVLAVPGYLAVDDREGRRLPGFEVLWNDDPGARFRHRGWAAERPKRYLAGAVVVGTIDQVLLSALRVDHAHLRGTSLLRHLLVVDEVHASDAYMNRILEEVLARHLEAGGHALLMSATLGAAAASRLLRPGRRASPPTLHEACEVPYPVVRNVPADAPESVVPAHGSGNHRRVSPRLLPLAGAPEEIARRALEASRAGARVLVLRNTVRDCLATQEALERLAEGDLRLFRCAGAIAPHHARFSRDDRKALDAAIEASFGKRAEGPCVAVTTQTVQQSLDLDADLLLTDLCPMDVLLQRVGRLHRHGRARPPGFEIPVVEVLVPDRSLADFLRKDGIALGPHGFGTVYADLRILEATRRLLSSRTVLRVPEDCRELVERTTHPEALAELVEALGEPWNAHQERTVGALFSQRRLADLNLLDWNAPFGEPPFPSAALDGRVQTRLGLGDRIARFDPAPMGPFGHPVAELTIPAFFAREAPADAEPADLQVHPGVFEFRFGCQAFRYDRLGLRTWRSPPDSREDLADA
jgi:CRISPR-associated endonuclease/helicase Cas3